MVKRRANERIQVLDADANQNVLFDLSRGGACCRYGRRLEKGAFVRLRIGDLALRARVVYSVERTDGFRMGVQFWGTGASEQKDLDGLVDRFSRGVPLTAAIEEEVAPRQDEQSDDE
jgi:hypothetical protein